MSEPVDSIYSGAAWIASSRKYWGVEHQRPMSDFGIAVANLLGDVFRGIYHLNPTALQRVYWHDEHCIVFVLGWTSLSTWDFNLLTTLVVLAHDRHIRVDISPRSFRYLQLMFHPRERTGMIYQRHPTIEEQIQAIRKEYGAPKDE